MENVFKATSWFTKVAADKWYISAEGSSVSLYSNGLETVSYPSQTLRNPEECGWKLDANKEYEAVTTILPPAAESIIHLTVCHCKTKCVTMRCKCRKNGLKCSEMCECLECENDGSDERDSNEIEDDLDNYI